MQISYKLNYLSLDKYLRVLYKFARCEQRFGKWKDFFACYYIFFFLIKYNAWIFFTISHELFPYKFEISNRKKSYVLLYETENIWKEFLEKKIINFEFPESFTFIYFSI